MSKAVLNDRLTLPRALRCWRCFTFLRVSPKMRESGKSGDARAVAEHYPQVISPSRDHGHLAFHHAHAACFALPPPDCFVRIFEGNAPTTRSSGYRFFFICRRSGFLRRRLSRRLRRRCHAAWLMPPRPFHYACPGACRFLPSDHPSAHITTPLYCSR